MKRLIFLDTNWILGENMEHDFPSKELKKLIDQKDELDRMIILPTVLDELVAKVGWKKVDELKSLNVEIIERIVGFPYEVFTRIKNRQPKFFRDLVSEEKKKQASYLMSNDFLIMFEMAAIVHDQLGKYGICKPMFLTKDREFKNMMKRSDFWINFEQQHIPPQRTEWIECELPQKWHKCIKPFVEEQSKFYSENNTKLVSNYEIGEVKKNKNFENEEYLVEVLIPFDLTWIKSQNPWPSQPSKLIEKFILTIKEGQPYLTQIKDGWNLQSYHLTNEKRVLVLLKNFLNYIYKDEEDWRLKMYFMNLTNEELMSLDPILNNKRKR